MNIEHKQIIFRKTGSDLYEVFDGETFSVQGLKPDSLQECLRRERLRIEQQHSWISQGVLEVPKVEILELDDSGKLTLLPDYVPTE